MDDSNVELMIGRRLRARRRLLGISQQALGAACGVTFQQIHKYEAAVCRMSAVTLWNLANALDVEISYFFTGLPDDEAAYDRRREVVPMRQDLEPVRSFLAAP